MKTINIEIPSGHEIDQEKSNLLEGKIVFKEIKNELPRRYSDLKPSEMIIANEIREAQVAMEMLFVLREVYRNGWKPDWKSDEDLKYIIEFCRDEIRTSSYHGNNEFLSFQSREIRDEFLKNFRDLIETAKPLIS